MDHHTQTQASRHRQFPFSIDKSQGERPIVTRIVEWQEYGAVHRNFLTEDDHDESAFVRFQHDLIRISVAHRRVQTLMRHLAPSILRSETSSQNDELQIIPYPGTPEHEIWIETLSLQHRNSQAFGILRTWYHGFYRSGSILRNALRRFAVLSSQLNFQTSIYA